MTQQTPTTGKRASQVQDLSSSSGGTVSAPPHSAPRIEFPYTGSNAHSDTNFPLRIGSLDFADVDEPINPPLQLGKADSPHTHALSHQVLLDSPAAGSEGKTPAETARQTLILKGQVRKQEAAGRVLEVVKAAKGPMTQGEIKKQLPDVSKKHISAALKLLPLDLKSKIINCEKQMTGFGNSALPLPFEVTSARAALKDFGTHCASLAQSAVRAGLAMEVDAPTVKQAAVAAADTHQMDPIATFATHVLLAGMEPIVEQRFGKPGVTLTIWSDVATATMPVQEVEAKLYEVAVTVLKESIKQQLHAEIQADPTRDPVVLESLIQRIGNAKADNITVSVWHGTWGERIEYTGYLCPLEWPCLFDQAVAVGKASTAGLHQGYATLTVTDTPWVGEGAGDFVAGLSDNHDMGRNLRDAIDDWYDAPPVPAGGHRGRRQRRFPKALVASTARRMM